MTSEKIELAGIQTKIYLIRQEKVMLDYDLAELYGVATTRLNEQVKRNHQKFPLDFAFRLTNQEFIRLISQFAISNEGRGGRRTPPMAFTEHGIAMLSSVLNSPQAIEINLSIIRTFIKLRQVLNSDKTFEKRLGELEKKYDGQFKIVFEVIREMTLDKKIPNKRIIGFK